MKVSSMFPGRYLKAADLGGKPMTLTIKGVASEMVGQGKDAQEKIVLLFKEREQCLVLNKTNAKVLANLFGDESDDWVNRRATFYPTTCNFGSQLMDCIRVKTAAGQAADEEGDEVFG